MPIYEYTCTQCHHRFSVLQRMGEGNENLRCEQCGTPKPLRQFSTFASQSGSSQASASVGASAPRGFS